MTTDKTLHTCTMELVAELDLLHPYPDTPAWNGDTGLVPTVDTEDGIARTD